jgi:hypothetical protein
VAEIWVCGWPCRANVLSRFGVLRLRMLRFLGRLGSFFGLRGFWVGLCGFCAGELGVMQLSVLGPRVGLWIILGRGGVGASSARPSEWRAAFWGLVSGPGAAGLGRASEFVFLRNFSTEAHFMPQISVLYVP